MIKGLHHNAYRCRDSEETRGFYEDFLGRRFVSAFEIDEGRGLHSFFEMDDGSCLASPRLAPAANLCGAAWPCYNWARTLPFSTR